MSLQGYKVSLLAPNGEFVGQMVAQWSEYKIRATQQTWRTHHSVEKQYNHLKIYRQVDLTDLVTWLSAVVQSHVWTVLSLHMFNRKTFFSFSCGSKEEIFLLWVLDQQTAYEVFGQLAGVAEILLIKVVVDGWDVSQRLLLGLAKKRRCTTQPDTERKRLRFRWDTVWRRWWSDFCFYKMPTTGHDVKLYSQNICDDSDAPAGTRAKPWVENVTYVNAHCQRGKKKKKKHILPHIRLQSKRLIVDYFWRCKAQRNELFNSNQMLRSETDYHPLTRFTSHASVGAGELKSWVMIFYSVVKHLNCVKWIYWKDRRGEKRSHQQTLASQRCSWTHFLL